jgi:glyoxylase-like metal-dependent hydrolase (beta-lactamase superfamily II)
MSNVVNAPEISALRLARALEQGEAMQVVDVRAPMRLESGRIDLVRDDHFINIRGSQLAKHTALEGTGIDPDTPVAVVCGRGNDSKVLAQHLNRLGCRAASLAGGMVSWMNLTLPREVDPPPSLDRFIQFDRVGKGALGYVLVSDGEALVVDPPRDPSAYLEAIEQAGARFVGVADTHVHADYISGAPAISDAYGVPYYLHPADAFYPYDGTPGHIEYRALEDGGAIEFGCCTVYARHTPGHTEGSLTYEIDDAVALTGDFVFVASVGRPDLAGKTPEWTAQLWQSLEAVKSAWSSEVTVYPAHYGADSERRDGRVVGDRFGTLLEGNEALRFDDHDAFASWVEARSASFPDAYRKIKAVNVGLLQVDEKKAQELEVGKNECALGGS